VQRKKLLFFQKLKVFGQSFAEANIMAAQDLQCAIDFRHPFFEPQRPKRIIMPQ